MTAPNPPREATRRVSDEDIARFTKYENEEQRPLIVDYCLDLRDSRALVADLTRRLAEAERRKREAWCAGRDAAAVKASDYAYTSVSDCEYRGMEEPDTGFVSCALDDVGECVCAAKIELGDKIAARIRALNPPKPEGDQRSCP